MVRAMFIKSFLNASGSFLQSRNNFNRTKVHAPMVDGGGFQSFQGSSTRDSVAFHDSLRVDFALNQLFSFTQ